MEQGVTHVEDLSDTKACDHMEQGCVIRASDPEPHCEKRLRKQHSPPNVALVCREMLQ